MPIRFQVDGDFYDHPKTIGMSDGATALWVRAGSYSAAKLSDGFVAEAALSLLSRCPEEAASELVERGLWRRVKGGFRFHQWDRRNLLRARVEAEREADRLRKRKDRGAGGQNATPQVNGHVVQPESTPDSARSPTGVRPLSVSVSVSGSVSGSGRGEPQSREPPGRCPDHLNDPRPPPCGACAEARKTHETWAAEKRARLDSAPRCRVHRGELAHNCRACRAEELNPA
jgi:hypothetical protein